MKNAQWLTATALLWQFSGGMQAAQNSAEYKAVNMLSVPQGYKIPIALAVSGDTVAVGFAHNVTRLHKLSDTPVEGSTSINAYAHMSEERPRTVAVAFCMVNDLHDNIHVRTVDRVGTINTFRLKSATKYGITNRNTAYCMAQCGENSSHIFLGGNGDTVYTWYSSGSQGKTYKGPASGHVNALEIVDNKWLVTGNYNGTIALFDIEQGGNPIVLGHQGWGDQSNDSVCCIAKQDSAIVYTVGNGSAIRVWDIRARRPLSNTFKRAPWSALAVLKSGYLAAGCTNKINIFDLRGITREPFEICDADDKEDSVVTALAPTDDGGFVSAASGGVVKLWK